VFLKTPWALHCIVGFHPTSAGFYCYIRDNIGRGSSRLANVSPKRCEQSPVAQFIN